MLRSSRPSNNPSVACALRGKSSIGCLPSLNSLDFSDARTDEPSGSASAKGMTRLPVVLPVPIPEYVLDPPTNGGIVSPIFLNAFSRLCANAGVWHVLLHPSSSTAKIQGSSYRSTHYIFCGCGVGFCTPGTCRSGCGSCSIWFFCRFELSSRAG